MKRLRPLLIGIVIVVALAYLMALGFMFLFQRNFQYEPAGRLLDLVETALTSSELVAIAGEEGTPIAGWYAPPAPGRPVILYFRGNSDSFSREHERFEAFVAEGYGYLAFDYRGFPGTPGEISEANILSDSVAAFDWLQQKGSPILLWGRSLGSGPATYVASIREAKALLLETPFDSAVAVAAERYGFLPVQFLMQDQFRVDLWIADVSEPVFVAHGMADRTIGVAHGQRVYELAPNKAGLWIEEGAGHSDLWAHGLWDRARAFFDSAPQS